MANDQSPGPRRGWILATLCLAQLMISLDVLIANVLVFTAAGMALLIGSALVGALTRGELSGRAVAAPVSGPHRRPGALRRIAQPS